MESTKVEAFLKTHGGKFPFGKRKYIRAMLEDGEDRKYSVLMGSSWKSPLVMWFISFFVGGFGIDRFMLGQPVAGIAKLLTLGGLGLWWLVDLFLVWGATKKYNTTQLTQSMA